MVTIDASVFVSAGSSRDPASDESIAFLRAVLGASLAVHQPTLTLVEVTASMARRSGDIGLAREAGLRLLQMPRLQMHPLDVEAAAEASGLAGRARLRGPDAIYAATALRHGATLVTLDHELLSRVGTIVPTVTPAGWIERS
ncbi:MAG: type II toxin-antitoxin system VapC family toxin [Chloroflexi bacterium]|nr:type II toxin-antitoxin system VapC family toxin [Chloroflexota bacterium]